MSIFSRKKSPDNNKKTTDDWKFFMQDIKTNVQTSIDPTSISKSKNSNSRPITETDAIILRHHQRMVEEQRKKEAEEAAKRGTAVALHQNKNNITSNLLSTVLGIASTSSNSTNFNQHQTQQSGGRCRNQSINRNDSEEIDDCWAQESSSSEVSLQERSDNNNNNTTVRSTTATTTNHKQQKTVNFQDDAAAAPSSMPTSKFKRRDEFETNRDTSRDSSAIVFSNSTSTNKVGDGSINTNSSNKKSSKENLSRESFTTARRKAQDFHTRTSTSSTSNDKNNFSKNSNNDHYSFSDLGRRPTENSSSATTTSPPPLSMKDVKERAKESAKQAHQVAGRVVSAMLPNPAHALYGVAGVMNNNSNNRSNQDQDRDYRNASETDQGAFYSTRPTGLEEDYEVMNDHDEKKKKEAQDDDDE